MSLRQYSARVLVPHSCLYTPRITPPCFEKNGSAVNVWLINTMGCEHMELAELSLVMLVL